MQRKIYTLIILSFLLILSAGKAPAEYTKAYTLYSKTKYQEAYPIFQDFIKNNPDHFYTGNCYYWSGIIDYRSKNYEQALINFSQVLTCKNTYKYADARLRMGLCYIQLDRIEDARKEFQRIIINHQDNQKKVKEAKIRLAKLK